MQKYAVDDAILNRVIAKVGNMSRECATRVNDSMVEVEDKQGRRTRVGTPESATHSRNLEMMQDVHASLKAMFAEGGHRVS